MILAFDTNVLIDILRLRERHSEADAIAESADELAISSVVVAELEAGARSAASRRGLEQGTVGALLRLAVIEAPDESDWVRTGRLLAEHPEWARTASRQNDVLLASQCARLGWILVTRDADFRELSDLIPGLRVSPPRPL